MTKVQQIAGKLDALYEKLDALEAETRENEEKAAAMKKRIKLLEKDLIKAFAEEN